MGTEVLHHCHAHQVGTDHDDQLDIKQFGSRGCYQLQTDHSTIVMLTWFLMMIIEVGDHDDH